MRHADTSSTEDKPNAVSRRGFLSAILGLGAAWVGAAVVFPLTKYLGPSGEANLFGKDGRAPVDKLTAADVAQPGMGKNASYAGRGLIVFRGTDGHLRAFDAKCTHAGCNVAFQGTKLYCGCHGGTYDLNGRNIAGPPPKPLTEFNITEDGGRFFVAPMMKKA